MNIDVDLPALEGFEEFDEMPALVSEEFEAAPRFLAVPIDLLWRNTVHYHYPVWVYFLINTCLTGLRSLGILSTPVVYLPALEGFEEFDDLPALVSEEFEAPPFLPPPLHQLLLLLVYDPWERPPQGPRLLNFYDVEEVD